MPSKPTGRPTGRPRKPKPSPKPIGRPTDYDPSYCDLVITAMGSGLSLTGFAGRIRVSRRTITLWMDKHPDFAEAALIGKAVRTTAYEEKAWGVAAGQGGPGSAGIIQFALKNMAPDEYADTQHHRLGGPNGGPIQTVDLTNATDEQLASLEALFGPLAAAGGDAGEDQG